MLHVESGDVERSFGSAAAEPYDNVGQIIYSLSALFLHLWHQHRMFSCPVYCISVAM